MFLAECSGAFSVSGGGNLQCDGILTSIETSSLSSGSSSVLPPLSVADAMTIATSFILLLAVVWGYKVLARYLS